MNKVIKILLLILTCNLLSQSIDNYNYGGGPNSFFQGFQTPRETAMGGAGISSAEGHLAYLWNPACMFNNFKKNYAPKNFSYLVGTNSVFIDPALGMGSILSDNFSIGGAFRIERGGNTAWLIGAGLQFKNYDNVIETEININDEVIFRDNNKHKYSEGMGSIFFGNETEDFTIGFSGRIKGSGFYKNVGYGFDLGVLIPSGGFAFLDSTSHGFNIKIDRDKINNQIRFSSGSTFIKKFGDDVYFSFVFDINNGSFMNPIINSGLEIKNNFLFFAIGADYLIQDKLGRSLNVGCGGSMDLEQKTVKFALSYSLELPNEFSKYYFLVSSPVKISLTLTEKVSKR